MRKELIERIEALEQRTDSLESQVFTLKCEVELLKDWIDNMDDFVDGKLANKVYGISYSGLLMVLKKAIEKEASHPTGKSITVEIK